MDFKITNGKHLDHFKLMKSFISKILSFKKTTDRLSYLKKITRREIDYVSEIVLNFLKNKIHFAYREFSKLKKIKNFMREFVKNKKAYKIKKSLILSVKGLYLLNVLLPLASKTLDSFNLV